MCLPKILVVALNENVGDLMLTENPIPGVKRVARHYDR
jgi:hypothetical protein